MRKFYAFLLLLLIGNFGFGQTTIAYQGFEQNSDDTWTTTFSTPGCTSGGDVWDYSTSLNSISPSAGSQFWGISDLNGNCGSSSGETIVLSDVSVIGYSSINISFDYMVNGFDNGDDIYYTVSIDGVNQTEVQLVNGSSNYFTGGYLTETINIPNGTSNVGLELFITQNGGDYAGLDDIKLEGTLTSSVDNPNTFSASTISSTQIDLAYAENTATDNVVIVFDTDNTFTTPNGATPTIGNTFAGGTVLFNGNGTGTFNHTGLTEGTTYYYMAYSYDSVTDEYSIGLSADGTTLNLEPTNHVDLFLAGANGSDAITLIWDDNSGVQPADGFLIVGKTGSGAFYTVSDGTDIAEDLDFSDDNFAVKVALGAETYEVTGLNGNTTYDFEIYPYTNSGTNIDYKTDTTIPFASATTDLYCTPAPQSVDGNGITNVTLGTINNSTGAETNNYGNYSAQSTDLSQGQTVDCFITFETGYNYSTKIWIDFNNDGDFDDSGEEVYSGVSNSSNPTTLTANLTIPLATALDQYRLRIGSADNSFGGSLISCYTDNYGSFEDYTINVIAATDSDSDADDPGSQPGTTTISSLVDTSAEAVEVFNIDLYDFGSSDGLNTNVTKIRLYPHSTNTADWTDNIQGVTVSDGSPITVTSVTIDDAFIDINFTSGDLTILDSDISSLSISVYLNTSNITDGGILSFMVDVDNHGFEANPSGSTFASTFSGSDFNSENFIIDIEATELSYLTQPTDVYINAIMSPSVEIATVDANGNIDIDFSGSGFEFSLTTDGNFSGSASITAEANNGIAIFDNLHFDTLATDIKLTVSDDSTFISGTYDSDTFDVEEVPVGPDTLWVEPFTDNSLYTVTLGAEGYDGNEDYLQITDGSDIDKNYTGNNGNFFAGQDIDDTGWVGSSSPSQLTWSGIDIAHYNTLNFSGSFASIGGGIDDSDYVLIEYSIDSGSWTNLLAFENDGSTFNESFLEDSDFDGDGDGGSLSGSFTQFSKEIAGTGITLDLRITLAINSGDEEIGLDDFSLTGLPDFITYIYNGTWSPSDPNGASLSTEAIIIESGNTSISTNTDINTITISPGAGLTIDSGATLTAINGITLESNATSYSSLILDGTIAGNVVYKRHVNTFNNTTGSTNGQNDLISPPVTNASQDFGAFRGINTNIPSGTVGGGTTTFYLFGPYDNNANSYTLFSDADDATVLTAGAGYRAASTDTSTFTFMGAVLSETVPVTITTGSENAWNLIGNPYPSYINSTEFLTSNVSNLDQDAVAIYGYDGDALNGWTVINLNNPENITPGQGFMVLADAPSADLNFTPTMRRVSGGDDFISGRTENTNAHFSLKIENNNTKYSTDFYFNNNSTRGLDEGYDATIFTSQLPDLYMYSHLVENNTGRKMTMQSLGETDLTDVTIPLGVNSNQLEQITFSIDESTLPNTVDVYLEDNVENTFTLLTSGDYTLTPNENLSGTGRFYLRFTTTALSIAETTLDNLNIYSNPSDKTIVVTGQLLETTTANLYDLQGRLVNSSLLLNTDRSHSIDVSNLSIGVYVVELINGTQNKTQKVILR